MNQNSFSFIWMRTVPPFTLIQKVDFMLPSRFSALHVYSPESSNLAWRIMRVFFLPRYIPSLIQSTSGVGKPLREHLNLRGELYVTDWFLSSGLISGGPGQRIQKYNSKKVKVWKRKKEKKNVRKWEEQLKETKLSQRLLVKGESLKRTTENEKSNRAKIRQWMFTRDCNMESWFTFPFTVFSAACVLTSISITHSINCESVVVTKIHPILSPEYLRCRETAEATNELKRQVIGNRLIPELGINFRRTWA